MNFDRDSLFQSGQLVIPYKFKGKEDILKDIFKYFPSVNNGNVKHFFIIGKRGMDKTSLANFISKFGEKNYSMITAHIMNNGVHSVNELITQIIERILKSIKSEKWHDKIFNILDNNIESTGISGFNVKFKPSSGDLKNIKDEFAFYITNMMKEFNEKINE